MRCYLTIVLLCISLLMAKGQGNTPANELIALPEGTVYEQLPNGYAGKEGGISVDFACWLYFAD